MKMARKTSLKGFLLVYLCASRTQVFGSNASCQAFIIAGEGP
jgi:hypothetical protein